MSPPAACHIEAGCDEESQKPRESACSGTATEVEWARSFLVSTYLQKFDHGARS